MPVIPERYVVLRGFVTAEAHHRVVVSLSVAGVVFFSRLPWGALPERLIMAWDVFALVSLFLAWAGIFFSDAKTRVQEAKLQDSNRVVIACCVVVAALFGLYGAAHLLGSARGLVGPAAVWRVLFAIVTVMASWLLVHTVFLLHYAHVCYRLAEKSTEKPPSVGLIFPGEMEPDFLDFAYFSFIIGMTCQTADVEISSRQVRRIALVHGLLSFAFNAVIVALSLNLASSLI